MIEMQAGILVINLPLCGGYRLELMMSLEYYGLYVEADFHTWGREHLRELWNEPHCCYGQLKAHFAVPGLWFDCDIYHMRKSTADKCSDAHSGGE